MITAHFVRVLIVACHVCHQLAEGYSSSVEKQHGQPAFLQAFLSCLSSSLKCVLCCCRRSGTPGTSELLTADPAVKKWATDELQITDLQHKAPPVKQLHSNPFPVCSARLGWQLQQLRCVHRCSAVCCRERSPSAQDGSG